VFPIKDNVPTRTTPFVTIGLIVANFIVWFWELQRPGVNTHVFQDGYYPCALSGPCVGGVHPLPWYEGVFTGMFMHASWLHILGNMLFLFIFGNNVEDVMGRLRFVVFYLAGGFAAALAQTWVTLHWSGTAAASIPNVGASGAIAAVLGAYLILLPHARVVTLLFGFLPFPVSAGFFLIVWFLFQLWQSNFSITHPGQGGGVAFAAHVGGFLFGALTIKVFQVRPPLGARGRR
jgi:membrane associated rhomboid family serine protease